AKKIPDVIGVSSTICPNSSEFFLTLLTLLRTVLLTLPTPSGSDYCPPFSSLSVKVSVKLSRGHHVCGEVAAVNFARVKGRSLGTSQAAGMLPDLPGVVPMKAKLGKLTGHARRLLLRKLNPHPFANRFGDAEKLRRPGA